MTKPKPKPTKVKIATYVNANQKRRLDELSAATRVPWSEYVREGVDMVLKRYNKKRPRGRR
jgi:hypothetical protein